MSYGDLLSDITISGPMTDPTTNETVQGTFAWDTPDKRMDAVGTYEATWKFAPDNTDIYIEVTGTVTITVIKATLTGEPDYTVITAEGKKLSDAALQANDKWPAGILEWVDSAGNVLSGDTEVRANTVYKWRFTPADANYNILTGEITLYPVYSIIDGANSSWTQNANGSLTIRGNGAFSKFVNVKVDGTIVDPVNYTVREGSTIIELKADYLKTLSEGSHTFEIAWTDGTASTSFTVAKNTSGNNGNDDSNKDDNNGSDDSDKDGNNDSSNDNSGSNTAGSADNTVQILTGSPNTGDALGLWINLFLASAAGLAVMLVRRKK